MNSRTAPSFSDSPDRSVDVEVITKAVRIVPTTVNSAKYKPLQRCADVTVGGPVCLSKLELMLILGVVGLRILLASGIYKNDVFISNL